TDRRHAAPVRYQPVELPTALDEYSGLRLLDTETGVLEQIRLPATDRIDYAVCSPWQDGQGRRQILGRWRHVDDKIVREAGLGRIAWPGGEVLERLPTESAPFGSPCWFPDRSARALISLSNGPLYFVSFEKRDGPGTLAEAATPPVPLTWR